MYRGYLPRDLVKGPQGARSLSRLPTATIACFGSRSRRVNFCIQALKLLIEIRGKEFDVVTAGTETAFRHQWASRKHDGCFIYLAAPDGAVAELFMQDIPFVVFNDSPLEIVRTLLNDGMDMLGAIRKTTEHLVKMQDLLLSNSAFVVSEKTFLLTFRELIASVASHFKQQLTPLELSNVAKRLSKDKKLREDSLFEDYFLSRNNDEQTTSLTRAQEELVESCLTPLSRVSATQPLSLTWPRDVFLGSENNPIKGPIELTGHVRRFIHGPKLHLPKGQWIAAISFDVVNSDSGNILNIEIHSKVILMKKRYILPSSGSFSSIIEFKNFEPSSPIEFRFLIDGASTAGLFTLHNVSLVRASL